MSSFRITAAREATQLSNTHKNKTTKIDDILTEFFDFFNKQIEEACLSGLNETTVSWRKPYSDPIDFSSNIENKIKDNLEDNSYTISKSSVSLTKNKSAIFIVISVKWA